jgi:hypothetical protein
MNALTFKEVMMGPIFFLTTIYLLMLFLQAQLNTKTPKFIILISKTPPMLPIRMKHLFTNKTFVLLFDKFTQAKGVVCLFT